MNFYKVFILSFTLSFASFAQSPCDGLPEMLDQSELFICEGDSVDLVPNLTGYDSYSWVDGSPDSIRTVGEEGEYIISGILITSNQTSNGDFESGNTGFTSEYTYNATTIWGEGTYSVVDDVNDVHPNLVGTGNGGTGNFLAVNGTGTANAEIWCQTIVVEPNTNYDFSAWVSSTSAVNPAILQFSIDGTLLGTPFNAPAATGVWDQFTSGWFSGPATNIEICITNQNTNLNGNDFGIDDIEFIAYCEETDTVELSFIEGVLNSSPAEIYCNNTFEISVIDPNSVAGTWTYVAPPGGPGNVTFNPSPNDTAPIVTVPGLGEYIFSYVSNCGDSTNVVVDVLESVPELDIVAQQSCNFDLTLTASNPVQNGHWTASSPEGETVSIADINNPSTTAEVSNFGTYTFTYTYDFCDASFTQEVEILAVDPIVSIADDYLVCNKTVQDLTAEIPGMGDHWEVKGPGAVTFSNWQGTSTDATVSDYGTYTFYYYGCNGVDSVDVEFLKQTPYISAPAFVKCGLEAHLQVNYLGETGNWNVSNSYGETFELTEISNYTATLSGDRYGEFNVEYEACDTSVHTTVVFYCDLEIANVFTPNNDGVNEEFTIERLDTRFYDRAEFTVFNRWGLKVYHNGQYGLNDSWWDGKDSKSGKNLLEGMYFYTLNLHNHVTGEDEKYSGTINLFR